MKKIFIVVEGYTELEFVKSVLADYIKERVDQDVLIIPLPVSTNADLGKKGGGNSYKHWKKELLKLTQVIENRIVTTFMDYYALPDNFPSQDECKKKISVDEKIACLEQEAKNDIAPNNYKFFPYIQKHEFESLLFSSNKGFESCYEKKVADQTAQIIKQYENPEEINDNPQTAPSKRLLDIVPEYDKILDGNIIALEIGIHQILEKCPRFRNWIETIIEKVKE